MSKCAVVARDPGASRAQAEHGFSSRLELALFAPAECDQALAVASAQRFDPARVQSGLAGYRHGRVAWVRREPGTEWVFERIERVARGYAHDFGIDVESLDDSMQLVEYGEGGFFDWHVDVGPAQSAHRKVTVCVQLTSGNAYEGGDLEFVGEQPILWRRAIGGASAFPSLLGHRLTSVKSGTRHALVAWMLGPPYR